MPSRAVLAIVGGMPGKLGVSAGQQCAGSSLTLDQGPGAVDLAGVIFNSSFFSFAYFLSTSSKIGANA